LAPEEQKFENPIKGVAQSRTGKEALAEFFRKNSK
jgi:hypothetical protein